MTIPAGKAFHTVKEHNRGQRSKDELHKFLRIARIRRVDYERFTCDIEFIDGPGIFNEVDFAVGSFGGRSFVGSMPEENGLVVIGWRLDSPQVPRPIIIAYLGQGVKLALNWDPGQVSPVGGVSYERPTRRKLVKIYPGDALLMASRGAFIQATDNLHLQDASGQVFLQRAIDRHTLLRTLNYTRATGAGRFYSGPAIRNTLIPQELGKDLESQKQYALKPHLYHDGKRVFYVTAGITKDPRPTLLDNANPYIEDRGVIREFSDMVMDVFGELDNAEIDLWVPNRNNRNGRFIEYCRGTYIGDAHDGDESSLYGFPVRLKLWGDAFDAEIFPELSYIKIETDEREKFLAIADHYRYFGARGPQDENGKEQDPKRQAYHRDIDKYGTVYEILPASGKENPLGEGISEVRALQGGQKEHYGKTISHGSAVPKTIDAIKGEKSLTVEKGISKFHSYDGALHFRIVGPDSNEDAYVLEIQKGNLKVFVNGNTEIHYTGNLQELVEGNVQRVVLGDVHERIEGNFRKEIKGEEFRHTIGPDIKLVEKDKITHIGGGEVRVVNKGQTIIIGQDIPVPPLPEKPEQEGYANEPGSFPPYERTQGALAGVPSPPTDGVTDETYAKDVKRLYIEKLEEKFLKKVTREYLGTDGVDEKYAGPVSLQYLQTLSIEVVQDYAITALSYRLNGLAAIQITAGAALTLTSAISITEAAPVVIRGN